jgi:hypothetical protein
MNEELDPVAQRLQSERPVPRAAFRGDLRRRLLAEAQDQPTVPRRLELLIAAYAGSGVVLLAVAVVSVAGIGPLAA